MWMSLKVHKSIQILGHNLYLKKTLSLKLKIWNEENQLDTFWILIMIWITLNRMMKALLCGLEVKIKQNKIIPPIVYCSRLLNLYGYDLH